MSFKLLSYVAKSGTAPRSGILVGDQIVDCATVGHGKADGVDFTSTLSILQSWDRARPVLEGGSKQTSGAVSLSSVKLAAPILYPTNIFCAAANYQDHFREMTGKDVDKSKLNPYFFNKVARQTVIGSGEAIRKPNFTQKLDWEAEIVAVIGKRVRNVTAAKALDYVMGYMIINDLSARDFLRRNDWPALASDWLWQKSFDTSAPMGPWITLKDDIEDPQNLKINTWVNDTLEQDTHSKWMVFSIAEQIEALSEHMTLMPGDVIATGTGGGVGNPKGKFLKPGDICRIEIEGLGEISNPVVAGE